MNEKLYTIPVNDAFQGKDECPVCRMHHSLETNAVDFTLGSSYMEDDVRMVTDQTGFCSHHVKMLYRNQNRLGLALMLKTHMDRTITELERLTKNDNAARPITGLFRKKSQEDAAGKPVTSYLRQINDACYVCGRMEEMFSRYLATVFYLYKNDKTFSETLRSSKGFCTPHYGMLREMAARELAGDALQSFIRDLDDVFLCGMKRVRDDLEWFTDKFDYRNADAPWKNAKDALPRSITKMNGVLDELS